MAEKKDVRKELIDMLQDLDERLEKVTADIEPIDPTLPEDLELPGSETKDIKAPGSSALSIGAIFTKIKKALSKSDKNKTAICIDCGAVIATKRLQLLPYTQYCYQCAQEYPDEP